jgi:hypothetical protein
MPMMDTEQDEASNYAKGLPCVVVVRDLEVRRTMMRVNRVRRGVYLYISTTILIWES